MIRPALTVLALLLLPAAQAGTREAPELRDPAGDVAYCVAPCDLLATGIPALEPWRDAIDLVAFWVSVNQSHAIFHYEFQDLSTIALGNPYGYGNGVALFQWTLLSVNGQELDEGVFFSYRSEPAAAPYWEFLFDYQPVNGTVDEGASVVQVEVPLDLLGAEPGGRLHGFYLYAADTPTFPFYAMDNLPDSYTPCKCEVAVPEAAWPESANATTTSAARDAPEIGPVSTMLAVAVVAIAVTRRLA